MAESKSKQSKAKKSAVKTVKLASVKSKKLNPLKEAFSKNELVAELADRTQLSKKQVKEVFDSFSDIIEQHIKPKGVGHFTLPGLFKIVVVKKAATKARKGINPFSGEEVMFKAKPARNIVKIKPLKKLKDKLAAS